MSRRLLQCSTTIPLPSQASPYNGNVRGYYFQAPTNFAITSISVPTTASTLSSTVSILRFNSGPPPEYSTTTNDFTQLGLWRQYSASTLSTGCICVASGQWIGVLGYRGTVNSYGNTPYSTNINGYSVTFRRMGMQFSLITDDPHDIWGQSTGPSLSRVPPPGTCSCMKILMCHSWFQSYQHPNLWAFQRIQLQVRGWFPAWVWNRWC